MSDPRRAVLALSAEADRYAEQSQQAEAAGNYEEAFAAMGKAFAAEEDAELAVIASGDEWLMSLWAGG